MPSPARSFKEIQHGLFMSLPLSDTKTLNDDVRENMTVRVFDALIVQFSDTQKRNITVVRIL